MMKIYGRYQKTLAALVVTAFLGIGGSSLGVQNAFAVAGDFIGPAILSYTFSPTVIDISSSSASVVVTAHVTDVSGVKSAPIIYIQNNANVSATQRTGWFALSSGTAQDGIYSATITIPCGRQPGDWSVFSNSFRDIANNDSKWPVYPDNNQRLTVMNSSVADFIGPTILSYTFSPTVIDISSSSASVVVTAHVTDVSGVKSAPIIYIQNNANVSATQRTGWFALSSGTAQDGIYSATITIPCGRQPGDWSVFSNSFRDIANNDSKWPVYPDNNQRLTVVNSSGICPVVVQTTVPIPGRVTSTTVPVFSTTSTMPGGVTSTTVPVFSTTSTMPGGVTSPGQQITLTTMNSLAAKSIATFAGLKVLDGSTVSLSVSSASHRVCRVSGLKLLASGIGNCRVTVTSKSKTGKKTFRTLSIQITK